MSLYLMFFSHCVLVELLWGGSATNGDTPFSFYSSEPVNELELLHPAHPLEMEVPGGGAPVTSAVFVMSLHSPLLHCLLESFLLHLLLTIIFPPSLLLPFCATPLSLDRYCVSLAVPNY